MVEHLTILIYQNNRSKKSKMWKLNSVSTLQIRFFSSRASRKVKEEVQEKLVKVAIIGLPNSGKSTLINSIMDQRICAVSDKVHTTTSYSQAITNRRNSQIIVFDTPGLVTKQEIKKHNLSDKFISSCRHSMQHSNLIGVLHDVSNHYSKNKLHPIILELLNDYKHIPSFLILNKIDKLRSKRSLLDMAKALTCNNLALTLPTRQFAKQKTVEKPADKDKEIEEPADAGWPHFKSVFMISSLHGDGIDKIVDYIESQSVEKPWEFKNNEVTDQKPEEIIEQTVRARLLDYLPQEIPYLLNAKLEYFSNENNKMFASVIVTCPNKRVENLVCGISDGKLRQITDRITSDLIQSFKNPVMLTLTTEVKKN